MVVQDSRGYKKERNVGASTWTSYDIGEEICFNDRVESLNFWTFFSGIIGYLIWVIIVGTLLVKSVNWLLTGNWSLDD